MLKSSKSKEWGKRRLAYEINDFREGFYQIVKVNAGSQAIDEYTRLANISEDIIRHIAVRCKKQKIILNKMLKKRRLNTDD